MKLVEEGTNDEAVASQAGPGRLRGATPSDARGRKKKVNHHSGIHISAEKSEGREDGCKHCGSLGCYARGLCIRCWGKEEVKTLYAPMGHGERAKRRGLGNVTREPPPAPHPTSHPPGSVGKFRVLMERARAGVQLWHPLDEGADLA